MSILKNKKIYLAVLLTICALFVFGCKNTVEVEDIYFNTGEDSLVFLVGDEYSPAVVVTPTYSSDTSYTITSLDTEVVTVSKNVLHMQSEGTALIKVVANSNAKLEDFLTIKVVSAPQKLSAPTNLSYNSTTQTITFDAVTNASSYTLKIANSDNEYEINLGNTTSYTLSQFDLYSNGGAYNNTLTIQVKANASANTNAFTSSDYSSEFGIYQASVVSSIKVEGGILSFSSVAGADSYEINFDGNVIKTITGANAGTISVDLKDELNSDCAGTSVSLKVEARVNAVSGAVSYYGSESESVVVSVLATPTLIMSGTILSWTNLGNSVTYSVYIAGKCVTTTTNNYFDLTTLNNFASNYGYLASGYSVYVDFTINESSKNVLRTADMSNTIKFNRLSAPTISISGDNFVWGEVADNSGYVIELKKGEDEDVLSSTIYNTSLSMANYEAGEYVLTVYAIGVYDAGDDTYYISSETASCTAKKLASPTLSISNYDLTFAASEDEQYYVMIDSGLVYSETITADSTSITIDLSTYDFSAGEHTIYVTNKALDSSTFSSKVASKTFTQLQALNVDDITISAGDGLEKSEIDLTKINSTVSISMGDINSTDNIYIEIVDTDSSLTKFEFNKDTNTGALTYDETAKTITITLNTTDESEAYYMPAGNYKINIYVKGDNSSEFSVQTNKTATAISKEFSVLESADLSLKETSSNTLNLTSVTGASAYLILQYVLVDDEYGLVKVMKATYLDGEDKTTVEDLYVSENFGSVSSYECSGSVIEFTRWFLQENVEFKFEIMSLGDGTNSLHSALKQACVVTVLKAPTLSYDDETGVVKLADENNASTLVSGYVVTHTYTTDKEYTDTYTITKISEGNYSVTYLADGNSQGETISDFDFISDKAFTNFKAGENVFVVSAVSILGADAQYYQNSTSSSLTINMISNSAVLTIDENSNLVVTTSDSTQYSLILRVKVDTNYYIFETKTSDENGGVLTCEDLTGELSYTYSEGVYTITLLDKYTPVISMLAGEFEVAVKFSSDEQNTAQSIYSDAINVTTITASTIKRNGDIIYVSNENGYGYSNFVVYVNEEDERIEINMETLIWLGGAEISSYDFGGELGVVSAYAVNFEKIITYLTASFNLDLNEILTFSLVTLNSATTNGFDLGAKSEIMYVQVLGAVSLTASKANDTITTSDTNSIVISFDIINESYISNYVLYFYDAKTDSLLVTSAQFENSIATDGTISVNLDDYVDKIVSDETNDFSGSLYVVLKVYANGNLTDASYKTIEVFNSQESDKLQFTMLDTVTDVEIVDGKISFTALDNENVAGYNVYYLTNASSYEKLNEIILTPDENNVVEFDLGVLTGKQTIVVRTVAVAETTEAYSSTLTTHYTNSTFSNKVYVLKLITPSVDENYISETGQIVVSLDSTSYALFTNEGAEISLVVTNITNAENPIVYELDFSSEAVVSTENYSITIDPRAVLSYGDSLGSIISETLTFSLKVNYSVDGEITYCYLNSGEAQQTFKGLLSVISISKTTNASGTEPDSINWTNNASNSELTTGYIVEIIYNEITYSTADANLMYYDSAQSKYVSYDSIITNLTSITFPAGYDVSANGELETDELFGAGTYVIRVIAVPSTAGYVASSTILNYTITKLSTPALTVSNGYVVWAVDEEVDTENLSYLIRVYASADDTSPKETDTLTTTAFDFSNSSFSASVGVFYVTVQTLSADSDVLNSKESDKICVYRLSQAESVEVNDGAIVLTANEYFTQAIITFTDTNTNLEIPVTYTNSEFETSFASLNLNNKDDWTSLTGTLENSAIYTVSIDSTTILSALVSGHCYKISVKLMGNSSNANRQLGIINSYTVINLNTIEVTKMTNATYTVTSGVLDFSNLDYNETYPTGYSTAINYNLNNVSDLSSWGNFWDDTLLYKITIVVSGTTHEIYAVDYDSVQKYITNGTLTEGTHYTTISSLGSLWGYLIYEYDGGTLYINIYEDNKINFRDNSLYYYKVTSSKSTDGLYTFSSSTTTSEISLKNGASFTVGINILGGDTIDKTSYNMAFLSSNTVTTPTFVRYGYGNFSLKSSNGAIAMPDKKYLTESTVDYPVYKLTVNENYVVYLYYGTIYDDEGNSTTIYTLSEMQEKYGTGSNIYYYEIVFDENGNVTYDFADFVASGTYSVKVQILAGFASGNSSAYTLDASEPTESYSFKKISAPSIGISSTGGTALQINLGQIPSGDYIYNYEITITDTTAQKSYTYTINSTTSGVSISSSGTYLIYTLPSTITTDDGENLSITNANSYTIKVRALATTNAYVLNSVYSDESTFTISEGVEDVKIEDGVLKWTVIDTTNYQGVGILISYSTADGSTNSIWISTFGTKISDGVYYYSFLDSRYSIMNSTLTAYIDSGVSYSISVCTLGNASGNILNSMYTTLTGIQRLAQVDSASIQSYNGVLTWSAVANAGYYVVYLYSVSDNTTVEYETELTTYVFTNLSAGNYTITIRAVSNGAGETGCFINGRKSSTSETFTQLGATDEDNITLASNVVTWDAVTGAQAYEIVFNYTGAEDSITLYVYVDETNDDDSTYSCDMPNEVSGAFTITITPIGYGYGYVFNGSPATYTSTTERPNKVDSVSVGLKNGVYIYYWQASDFQQGDSFVVYYEIAKYNSAGNTDKAVSYTTEISYSNAKTITIDDVSYYYYAPTIMGVYTNFSITVKRENNGYTSASVTANSFTFNIFAYGEGTETSPYVLTKLDHLLNIKYFASSSVYFKLGDSISLAESNSDFDVATQLSTYGALVYSTFSGTLDGDGKGIYGLASLDLDLTDCTSFGLFATLNGATIKNLVIGEANESISLNLSYTANAIIKIGLLAVEGTNTTISDVQLLSPCVITIESSVSLTKNIYLSGLLATASNCTLSGVEISSLTFNLNAQVSTSSTGTSSSYVGGLMAYASESTLKASDSITTNTLNVTVTGSSSNYFDYVGGVAGYFVGTSSQTDGIYSTSVQFTLTIYAYNTGGLVGRASSITISGCETSGSISYGKYSDTKVLYIGGLVGYAQNCIISSSGTSLEISFNSINSTSNTYIGAIVGYISSSSSSLTCSITDCYAYYETQTVTTFESSVISQIGIYGSAGSGVTVSGFETKSS